MSDEIKAQYDTVIIGSGFAGICAAGILADHGLSVLMVDENINMGGQLLRKIPKKLGNLPGYRPDYVKKLGFKFIDNLKKKKLDILNGAAVFGIYPDRNVRIETREHKVVSCAFSDLIFATGARERNMPFPGWTLPGVFSAGMIQVLLKSYGVLPEKRILVGGSGLFLLSAACEILKSGGRVCSVLEQSTLTDKIKLLPHVLTQPAKMTEGARFVSRLILSGVPVKHRTKILAARGREKLEEVIVARTRRDGSVRPGTEKIIKTEAMAVGYGFVPNIELPVQAGCRTEFNRDLGGWIIEVSSEMETSVMHMYAAGEPAGIGGAFKSIVEGELAARTIIDRKSEKKTVENSRKIEKLKKQRKKQLAFGRLFTGLYHIEPRHFQNIPDETVICRCEDVRMKDIREAIRSGCCRQNDLKTTLRTTMGSCQGRTCGPVIHDILQAYHCGEDSIPDPISVRPPVKPVRISSFERFK